MDLLVSEKKKTKEWIKKVALEISSLSKNSKEMKKDIISYNYFNNKHNEKEFAYLTESGGSVLPSQLTHIPLQRNLLNSLISEYTIRPIIFSTFLTDKDSLKKKRNNIVKQFFDRLEIVLRSNMFLGDEQIKMIDDKLQQINSMVEQQPQSEEEAQMIAQLKKELPALNVQLKTILSELKKKQGTLNQEIENIDRFIKTKYREPEEIVAQKMLQYFIKKYEIKEKSIFEMTNKLVTGKPYYYVDLLEGDTQITFEALSVFDVQYPQASSVKWIQDGDWVKVSKGMPYTTVVSLYGDELKKKYGKDILEEIKDTGYTNADFVDTPEGAMENTQPYAGTPARNGIDVEMIWYRSPVQIKIKMSPNKYKEGEYFRHFIDKYKEIIDSKDYNYQRGVYVNKDNDKDIYSAKETETYNSKKGQKVKTKYSADIYKAIIIAGKYVVQEGKMYAQLRNPDKYSDVKLPVIGPAYNSIDNRPYSLVWSTKPLQDAYNKIYFHRELMLNLAGTKSVIYDRSQKPTDLKDEEWETQKKLGNIYIQTTDSNGNPIRTSFNQWSMIDLSVSPAIQYLSNMLEEIKATMGDIIGVPRQRLGLTAPSDQVGTYERSLERSMIITEILFYENDMVLAKALTHLLQLATKYLYKDGGIMQYIGNDLSSDIINIPKGLFDGKSKLDVFVLNNNEDAKKLRDLRDIMMMGYKSGALQYGDIVSLWDTDSVSELKNKIEYFNQKAIDLANQAREADTQQQLLIQQQQIKLAQEYDGFWKQKEMEIEAAKIKVDETNNNIKAEIERQKNLLVDKQIEVDKFLKVLELNNEQVMESAVLKENAREADLNAQIKAIELKLNSMMNAANIRLQARGQEVQHKKNIMDNKTKELQIKTQRKQAPEHTSDK